MTQPTRSFAVARLVVLVVLLIGVAIAVAAMGTDGLAGYLEEVAESSWGVALFMLLYVAGVVLMVPGTIGTLTSGAVFGFVVGFPVAFFSALIGAILAFFVARLVGREGMTQLLGDRIKGVDGWISSNDFVSILLLRLMPIVPFNALNYAAGVTGVRSSRYMLATAIGISPGTGLSAAAGSMASEPSSTAFILVTIAIVVVTVISTVMARRWTTGRSVRPG